MNQVSATHDNAGPIQIDVGAVIRTRLGKKASRVPEWIVRKLEKIICQDKLNEMLRIAYPSRGADFCRAVLDHLDIKVTVKGEENMPIPEHGRVIFVSNHPLGGLDGLALIDFVKSHYGKEPYFIVNDILMAVEPLSDVFLPINKHGAQSRASLQAIDRAMASDRPVIIFPAGLCSRRRGGTIRDLEWKKTFVHKAREFRRDIVPLRFDACNSPSFYKAARWRERLGIKFNIEMILLPGEIFKAAGSEFTINVGRTVRAGSLSADAAAETLRIRQICENL